MTPVLLLIDLQHDFLAARDLQPAAGQVIERATALLQSCRRKNIPVIHVWTTVQRTPDNRMPHWKSAPPSPRLPESAGRWICEQNTPGHAPPPALRPIAGEPIIHKQFFSGFSTGELQKTIMGFNADTLLLAGIHLHSCIRATALDAYAHRYTVYIGDDAVASDDPVHAAITRRYLSDRSICVLNTSHLLQLPTTNESPTAAAYQHDSPTDRRPLWQISITPQSEVSHRAAALKAAWRSHPMNSHDQRAQSLRQLASLLMDHQNSFAQQIMQDVGKPIRMARAEVARSADLLRATASQPAPTEQITPAGTRIRRQPLGLVAVISPWNNPLAIPVGKIAPAFFFGNAILWKPALPGAMIARRLVDLWKSVDSSVPIEFTLGDRESAAQAAADPSVDALTLSGSLQAGHALGEIAARRIIPYQAELGGNNAAILAPDADLASAAKEIASGAFGFAGQRCTANRRAIVVGDAPRLAAALEALATATQGLPWGDPADEHTIIGPVINPAKRDQLSALLQRAHDAGLRLITPHAPNPQLLERGAFIPSTIVLTDNPQHEIVQEESFGPILVVQSAATFDEALQLCNSVRQGLVAACFTHSETLKQQFLTRAHAGILKLNQSTSDADAISPFGGWKSSGIGPPEHGPSDCEFFTRTQTLYGS